MLSLYQESRWVRTPLSCPGTSQFLVLALRTYTWTGYSPAGSQVDTYLVIFLGHAYFSFFSVFKSVHTRKRNVGIVFARNLSFSSPSTRKRWQSGVMRPKISTIGTVFRNLLFWYSKSRFFGTRNHVYVWTEETEKKNLPFQKYPGAILIKLQKHANRPNSSIASSKNSERWRNKKDIKHSRTTGAFRKNKTAPKLLTGAVIEYARNVCKPPA